MPCVVLGSLDSPDQFWLRVDDGVYSYFFEARSQTAMWNLPYRAALAWRQRLIGESTFASQNPVDEVASVVSGLSANKRSSARYRYARQTSETIAAAAAVLQEKFRPRVPVWTVKIHPDSGVPFYVNSSAMSSTWWDPFKGSIPEMLDREDAQQMENDLDVERRDLAGFDECQQPNVFTTSEFSHAVGRLHAWLERSSIPLHEYEAVRLRFPSYTDCARDVTVACRSLNANLMTDFTIFFPTQQPAGTPRRSTLASPAMHSRDDDATRIRPLTSVKISLQCTVAELIARVFTKYRTNYRNSIADTSEGFVLKVVGFNDYLMHPTFLLGYYDHVIDCVRKRQPVKLKLLQLTEADQIDLSHVMQENPDSTIDRETESMGLDKDEFAVDERTMMRNKVSKLRPVGKGAGSSQQRVPMGTFLDAPDTGTASSLGALPVFEGTFIDQSVIEWPLRVQIMGATDCVNDENLGLTSVFVEVSLFLNGEQLPPKAPGPVSSYLQGQDMARPMAVRSVSATPGDSPRFGGQRLNISEHNIADLHPATRVGFMLYGIKEGGQEMNLGGGVLPLVDCEGRLLSGKVALRLWPTGDLQLHRDPNLGQREQETPRYLDLATGCLGDNHNEDGQLACCGVLHVNFDVYNVAVYSSARPSYRLDYATSRDVFHPATSPSHNRDSSESRPRDTEDSFFTEGGETNSATGALLPYTRLDEIGHNELVKLEELVRLDALSAPNDMQCQVLWNCRMRACNDYRLLAKFLCAVNWCSPVAVHEARRMLAWWMEPPVGSEATALELLDVRFGDPVVREYAVMQIDRMRDFQLQEYLLQLVQALKYETYTDSPLARMLLRRALRAPQRIGYQFFWLLRSEMHGPDTAARFGPLLLIYLRHCGAHATYLRRQHLVNDLVRAVAEGVKRQPKPHMLEYARNELTRILPRLPPRFTLCLNPRVECRGIRVQKCKVMYSKKLPLWINFENYDTDGESYLAIYKCGDDLRQDLMTLQMLRIMDIKWLQQGIDLRLRPYGCCATGKDLGWIEVVKNSATTSHIQVHYGGGSTGAFKSNVIWRYLKQHNTDGVDYHNAVENFTHSCAGYCVATYVMGIGDRHADNIMVAESGHLFHIDFGHFLGNFKYKLGIKRERAPFVFTPDMKYVMVKGSDSFRSFQERCCDALNVLRRDGNLLIVLFLLMVPARMPELLEKSDIAYLREMLDLYSSDKMVTNNFKNQIKASLSAFSRQVDNFFHNAKHSRR